MSDDPSEPFGKETARAGAEVAKFGTRLLNSLDKLGNYVANVVDRTPHNLVGVLGGDWLREVRIRNWTRMQAKTRRILEERGRQEPFEEISPSLAVPLLEAAIDETREELADLWAKLLAAAMDPKRKQFVRADLISTLRQLEPIDARVLDAVYDQGTLQPNARDNLAQRFSVSADEILVSLENLAALGCLAKASGITATADGTGEHVLLGPLGRLLIQAVR